MSTQTTEQKISTSERLELLQEKYGRKELGIGCELRSKERSEEMEE